MTGATVVGSNRWSKVTCWISVGCDWLPIDNSLVNMRTRLEDLMLTEHTDNIMWLPPSYFHHQHIYNCAITGVVVVVVVVVVLVVVVVVVNRNYGSQ